MRRSLTDSALFAGFFLLLSGLWLTGEVGSGEGRQLVLSVHIIAGIALLVPLVWGIHAHIRTRLQIRPGSVDKAAITNGVVLGLVMITGLAMLQGLFYWSESIPSFGTIHLWSAIALIPVTFWHVRRALRRHPGHRPPGSAETRRGLPHLSISLLALTAIIGAGEWLGTSHQQQPATTATPGEAPFLPARTLTHGGKHIDASLLGGSEKCASCHPDIYRQWSESMHRASASDPHVATGIDWFRRDNGVEASRLCASCHDPIPLLAGELSSATSTMTERAPAHEEGVSCMVCHSIDQVARELPGNGSYRIASPQGSILGHGKAAAALSRLSGSAHSEAMMRRPLMEDSKFCAACHQQLTFSKPPPYSQEDVSGQFSEWSESHFAEHGSEQFQTCQDCHMPPVAANDPAATNGKVRSHRFIGGNHAHAVAAGFDEQARLIRDNLKKAVGMELRVSERQDEPGHLMVEVEIHNRASGHNFPTGVTDIKEAWIELVALNGEEPIFSSGLLDQDHYLDKDAHSYRKVLVDHRNLPVDLHNLMVVKGTLFERTIASGQRDLASYKVPVDSAQMASLQLVAKLRMRRANQRWNDWLFNFDGRTVPVIDIHQKELTVQLNELQLPAKTTTEATVPINNAARQVPDGMVWIPAGPSQLGDQDGEPDEQPPQQIELTSFAIDRYPVTNANYGAFLRAQGAAGPVLKLPWAKAYNWKGLSFPTGSDQQPAILVTRDEASAYCRWKVKGRLPTEAEWEKAARGPANHPYPWGTDWQEGHCEEVEGRDVPPRVGMCPQRDSGYGVSDLVGGVFEWTADSYASYDRSFLHSNANEWLVTFDPLMYSVRGSPPGQVGPATASYSRSGQNGFQRGRVGFRCVLPGEAL